MSVAAHTPVLLEETVQALAVQPGGRYIDCTVGAGGHATAVLDSSSPGGQLLGIDADPQALKVAEKRLAAYGNSVLLVNDNFSNLQAICFRYDFYPVHGILFDLGLSSLQLDDDSRGFSFQREAPLDMRLSPGQRLSAADIVNTFAESELAQIIRKYGDEGHSHRIARYIVGARPVTSALRLAQIVEKAVPRAGDKIHPATKTFQALRIAVNDELEHLEGALRQAVELLGFGGRLVVTSYHSLEDRIVKQFMHREAKDCICPPGTPSCICGHNASLNLINRKVITPSAGEVKRNPRCRSARLRAVERINAPGEYDKVAEGMCFSMAVKGGVWRRPVLLKKLRAAYQ
ncbi:16S rRNA (cytosine(1402)-N(4))-methyltransferase RsmH [Chloroflexota bacterium]